MARVTVAICTYNRSDYLRESLQSVLDQTYRDIDIVIYDNASTDDTEEVVRSYKDHRITYVKNTKNIGQFGNMNKALENCKTEYISILHDDDIMLPNTISTEISLLDKHFDALIILQMYVYIFINQLSEITAEVKHSFFPVSKIFNKDELISLTLSKGQQLFFISSAMFRNGLISKYGLRFDARCGVCADWLFLLQANHNDCKIIASYQHLVKYRRHNSSESQYASDNDGWNISSNYIAEWLHMNGFQNTKRLEGITFIAEHLRRHFDSTQLTASKISDELCRLHMRYNWSFSGQDAPVIACALLSKTVIAIGSGKSPISQYYSNRCIVKKTVGSHPSVLCELKWFLKYFIFMKFIRILA